MRIRGLVLMLGMVLAGTASPCDTISKGVDVLLGNSFLQHVQMRRTGDTMVLSKAKGM